MYFNENLWTLLHDESSGRNVGNSEVTRGTERKSLESCRSSLTHGLTRRALLSSNGARPVRRGRRRADPTHRQFVSVKSKSLENMF